MTLTSTAPAPDESSTGKHLPALDGLRGLAILAVLACHLLASNPYPQGNRIVRILARLHEDGWIGVDLFFVLSGFLITGILYDTLPDKHFFRNFYVRRVLRIFPLYYGFLLLLIIITLFTHDHWFVGLAQVATYTENLPFAGKWLTDAQWINLNHFWSLAIEEQFYFVWPFTVFLLRTKRRIALVAVCGIVFSVLVRWAWVAFSDMRLHPYVVYSWTPSRLDGLLTGALLALVIRSRLRGRALRWSPWLLGAGLAALAGIWAKDGSLDWMDHPAVAVMIPLVLAVTFAGLLGCCLRPRTALERFFSRAEIRFFGKYSYGLYVFHYTLVAALLDPMRKSLVAHGHSKLLALMGPAALTFVLTVVLSWLSFRFFEFPFLRLKDRFTNKARRPRLQEVMGREMKVAAK